MLSMALHISIAMTAFVIVQILVAQSQLLHWKYLSILHDSTCCPLFKVFGKGLRNLLRLIFDAVILLPTHSDRYLRHPVKSFHMPQMAKPEHGPVLTRKPVKCLLPEKTQPHRDQDRHRLNEIALHELLNWQYMNCAHLRTPVMLLSIVERKTSSIIYYLIFEYARDSSCLGGVHGLPHLLEKELLQQVCKEGLGLGFRV